MTISFAVLLYYGREIYREAPPIPDKVVASDGAVLFSAQDIKDGQNVWQSTGGQQLGSIWGHGAYQAPDWTADWLHREAEFMINRLAREAYGKDYGDLAEDEKAAVQVRLQQDMRTNTYDPETGLLTISDLRAELLPTTVPITGDCLPTIRNWPTCVRPTPCLRMPSRIRSGYA